ncbi:hypothetical protein Tco_1369692 [Tanacetum coccineum]
MTSPNCIVTDVMPVGKENGLQILQSIDQGPFELRTTRDALGTTPEGGVLLGPERPHTYEDLSDTEKKRYDANNQRNYARGNGTAVKWGSLNRAWECNAFQGNHGPSVYNCNGVGHIARNYTQPKRPQNSDYFKDKMLLMQAQENGVVLDEEELLFLADECDAFDSDVDDEPTAQSIFMANLSSVGSANPQAGPSNASILSEVYDQKTKTALGANPFYLRQAKKAQLALYDGDELLKPHHVPVIVSTSEEKLELAEATRNKLHVKMNDSIRVEKRVNITPPNFSKENFMATFTHQTQLTPVQVFWSLDLAKRIQKSLVTEVRAMKAVFENLEAEVDQNETDLQSGDIERKNLLITNENLVVELLRTYMADLESENFNMRNKIQNDDHDSMIKHFSKLEVEHFNLQLKYQNLKERFRNKKPVTSSDAPSFDTLFVIGKLNEQIQSRGNMIYELKEKISRLTKKNSDTDHTFELKALVSQNKDLTTKLNALHDLNECFRAQNTKVKQHYKELYDLIKITRAKRDQLRENSKYVTIPDCKPKVLAPDRYPIDVEPISSRLKKNREVHLHYIECLKENVETLHEIVEDANVERPLDTSLALLWPLTRNTPPKVLPTKQWKPIGILLPLGRTCPLVRSTALKSNCLPADPQETIAPVAYNLACTNQPDPNCNWGSNVSKTPFLALFKCSVHLPAEEPILGYLKFSAKGTKREVFGMPIPNELITDDIRGADYYDAYLEKVAKHQRYLAGEEVSDPDSPAPKPAKSTKPKVTKQAKPVAPKAATKKPQPAPTKPKEKKRKQAKETTKATLPAKRAKAGKVVKKRTLKKSQQLVDEFVDEGIPLTKSGFGDLEDDTQRAIEESLKDAHSAPRGPLPPVVFRETDTGKFQPLPEVEGKGKEKVGAEQAAQVLLNLQTPKKNSQAEQYIFQRRTSAPTEPSGHNESSSLYVELGLTESDTESNKEMPPVVKSGDQDEGQAGRDPGIQDKGQAEPNPDDVAESQPLSTPGVHAGPNLEHTDAEATDATSQPQPGQMDEEFTTTAYPNVQENLKLTVDEPVIPEEPASSTGTLSSLQHLAKDFSFGDQFFNDKPSEADNEKTTADTEAESMVSVTIHQDTSAIPPMTSPVIDLVSRPDSPNVHQPLPTTTTATATTTTTIMTTIPLPPQPQQGSSDSILINRLGELEQHITDLVDANQALEERLDKHGSRLYRLENQDIPNQVSKAVDEIVTDAVDWAMQAPLRECFRDLPEADMKEILHNRMWESKSYQTHEDHMTLYEALEKSMARDNSDQLLSDLAEVRKKKKKRQGSLKTPPGSPPHPLPPPPPPASPSGTSGASGASGSSQSPPPPPPSSNNQGGQSTSTAAPSSSKIAALAEYTAWTMTDTRLKSSVSPIHKELHMDDDMTAEEQAYSSRGEDVGRDHIPTINLRYNVSKPLPLGGDPGHVTIQPDFFFNKDLEYLWYGRKIGRPALSISKMKAAYYPDVDLEQMVPDQMWIEEECKYDVAAMYGISHWWF